MSVRTIGLLALSVLLLLAAACDDSTSPVDEFKVTIQMVDRDGDPVPDLDLYLLSRTIKTVLFTKGAY